LRGLTNISDPNLLIGSASSDDAAIYRISDEIALVQTLDFFTPIVDDPYLFGQIAAANSLSDVYAMGGKPITAMNIVAVPTDHLDLDTINMILRGGADKVAEAECSLSGGHTVQNPEPLYGLIRHRIGKPTSSHIKCWRSGWRSPTSYQTSRNGYYLNCHKARNLLT
jgi:selenide,water dikinase